MRSPPPSRCASCVPYRSCRRIRNCRWNGCGWPHPGWQLDAGAAGDDGVSICVASCWRASGGGLSPDMVGEPHPLCIVEHPGSHVSDLGLALTTHLTADAVLAAHRDGGNVEYDRILACQRRSFRPSWPRRGDLGGAGARVPDSCRAVDSGIRFESLTLAPLRTNIERSHAPIILHR